MIKENVIYIFTLRVSGWFVMANKKKVAREREKKSFDFCTQRINNKFNKFNKFNNLVFY